MFQKHETMTIAQKLQEFYLENNFPKDGGENAAFFELTFKLFTIKLPNSQFRKEVIHMHDIQHILYNCDTTWKGESFIAGWEIGTKMWKHLPIGLMSLWAMGFSFLNYPKEVLNGYKKGINVIGIIDLKIEKNALLNLSIDELKTIIKKKKPIKMNTLQWVLFVFWITISEIIVLSPLLLIFLGCLFYI